MMMMKIDPNSKDGILNPVKLVAYARTSIWDLGLARRTRTFDAGVRVDIVGRQIDFYRLNLMKNKMVVVMIYFFHYCCHD